MEEQDMTAQQAAAGNGFGRSHKKRSHGGCRFSHRNDGQKECGGVIKRTIRGISEAFGIPRKGVLIAFILVLIFSFPVGVMLFGLAWAYVHHPDWFASLRGKVRGAGQSTSAGRAARHNNDAADAADARPTVGVDYEESWMEELREQFDDLERRTGSMEGFVASGDYRMASEFKKMKEDDEANAADQDAKDKKSDEPKA
jgi:phage shock protein PspC (stress-responsive transcriptional regulator)